MASSIGRRAMAVASVECGWTRHGIGRALLQAVFAWARQRGLKRLGLWAPAHSLAALGLYRQAGFHETGRRRPLPTNPALQILGMECELRALKTKTRNHLFNV
jgi:ribosomal protein S18 acetylase RimI-like enzyme